MFSLYALKLDAMAKPSDLTFYFHSPIGPSAILTSSGIKRFFRIPYLRSRYTPWLHGSWLAVLAAARAEASGASINEIVVVAEEMGSKVELFFVVDTLEYLHRGGRIGTARRYLAIVLQIKPILQFKGGLIGPLSQARTKKKAIGFLLDLVEERLDGKRMGETAVVDIDCSDKGDALTKLVDARFTPPIMLRAEVSPVVGTNVGPGGLGIAFYPED